MNKKKLAIAKRFIEERKKITGIRSKFAELIEESEARIRGWEKGSEIPSSILPKFVEAGLDVVYIITGKRKPSEAIPLPEIAPDDFCEIPFYPDEIAAGLPLNVRDNPEGIVIVHRDWCKQPEHMVAVRVSSTGTSMEPTIPAGAIVTIDISLNNPEKLLGQVIAIYKKDDGATIKRLSKTSHGWCGVPDNRDPQHSVIVIEEGDRIIGKVSSIHYAL